MNRLPLIWTELEASVADYAPPDPLRGPTNAQSRERWFNHPISRPEDIQVILYRDHHAWCPYCQKVWLWLEFKRIPYRVEKVTMFCYGQKEAAYIRKVPSGMLPALELKGKIITESDNILSALEHAFGELGASMHGPQALQYRQLERQLFRVWCQWLCRPLNPSQSLQAQQHFTAVAQRVESALSQTPSPFFFEALSTVDLVFVPYLERMHSSLFYYKGYNLREAHPIIDRWFRALEAEETYRGTQSDIHTHAHDLPPQMGGCYVSPDAKQAQAQSLVDQGPWDAVPDTSAPAPLKASQEAVYRVIKHHEQLILLNPCDNLPFDTALRCALSHLLTTDSYTPPTGTAMGLRYLRDRISVPRDMGIHAAKQLRQALEYTATLDTQAVQRSPYPIPTQHRYDQDPAPFQNPGWRR